MDLLKRMLTKQKISTSQGLIICYPIRISKFSFSDQQRDHGFGRAILMLTLSAGECLRAGITSLQRGLDNGRTIQN
ncbi:hypothetical protein XI04_03690 [Bradyrhizobium sp. CCBAU 11430]|nr:hypothetical protein [Bradyrhizobium sp. CCBAU 11430]